MKSHTYNIRPAEMVRLAFVLLVPMMIFAAVARIGALIHLWPSPWPALDVDHTILTHQAEASRTANKADLLLIGDSSCLMDLSGKRMQEIFLGKHDSLNLGTLMYLGFHGDAEILSRYASTNPGRLQTVIVLVHPEMLRSGQPVSQYLVFLSNFYAGADSGDSASVHGQLCGLFGLDIFQDRFLTRLPLPLPKEYGHYYGFNLGLYKFMNVQHGSAVDPHQYTAAARQGNAEYRLAPAIEPGCAALRAAVPLGAKLAIGLTPIPESFAPTGYATRSQNLLRQWARWMSPEIILTNLPATMPDSSFASTMHLNEPGALRYTEILINCLQPLLQ